MIHTAIGASEIDTLHAAKILKDFLTVKYHMEIMDARTLQLINADIASFCAMRRDIKPLIAVFSEDRYRVDLCLKD